VRRRAGTHAARVACVCASDRSVAAGEVVLGESVQLRIAVDVVGL
jgi:hypothetical protein